MASRSKPFEIFDLLRLESSRHLICAPLVSFSCYFCRKRRLSPLLHRLSPLLRRCLIHAPLFLIQNLDGDRGAAGRRVAAVKGGVESVKGGFCGKRGLNWAVAYTKCRRQYCPVMEEHKSYSASLEWSKDSLAANIY